MKQYDATSLPNPQIKHAKNVGFPLNDKDSYFGLKILRQKEIFIACLYIPRFLQLCFIILKICANMTYYSGISKYASDENVWGHFPLIKSLHIFWYLAMTVELTGTVEKKHRVLQLLLHIVFWMLALQFRTVSLDHFYYCVQSSHPLLWWRRRRRLFMGGNIAHISHNRWWCTLFEPMYFSA